MIFDKKVEIPSDCCGISFRQFYCQILHFRSRSNFLDELARKRLLRRLKIDLEIRKRKHVQTK